MVRLVLLTLVGGLELELDQVLAISELLVVLVTLRLVLLLLVGDVTTAVLIHHMGFGQLFV